MKESSPMEEENLQSSSTGLEQELPLRMGIARGPRRGWRRPQRRDAGSCSSRARPPPPPATSTAILGLGIALLCAPLCWVDPSAASASGAEPGSEPGSVPVSEPGPGRGGGEVQWRRGWERRPDPRRAFAFRSRQDKGRRLRPRPGRNAEAVWDSTWGSAWDRGPITARTEDWGKSDGRGLAWGRNGVEGDGRSSQLRRAAGLRGRASAAAPSPAPKCAWCASLADGWHKDSNRSSASGPLCFLCQAGTLRRIESSGPHCPCAMESLRRGLAAAQGGPPLSGAKWAEVNSLLAFKHANVDPGSKLASWVASPEDVAALGPRLVCRWAGVGCTKSGHVRSVQLSSKDSMLNGVLLGNASLAQSLPPELGDLTSLAYLDLSYNTLIGPIPPELARCTALSFLSLNSTQLTGSLPSALSALTNLQFLSLYSTRVTGSIPPQWGALTALTFLDLGSCLSLTGPIPAALGALRGLRHLAVGGNAFSGPLPASLGALTNLTLLDFQDNSLSGPLPSELGDLVLLQYLNLGLNPGLTRGVPPSFSRLRSLTSLTVSFSDSPPLLPSALWAQLSGLCSLSLSGVSGPLPPTLGVLGTDPRCTQTQELSGASIVITSSRLTGGIPEALVRGLCSPERTVLGGVGTGGGGDGAGGNDTAGALSPLVWLTLADVGLDGPFPTLLSSCVSLNYLALPSNGISGPFPPASFFAPLKSLQYLYLDSNNLAGPLPLTFFSLMPSLRYVHLENNTLSGPAPPIGCAVATSLVDVYLGRNQLTGNATEVLVPSILGCTALETLDLSHNRLWGEVPREGICDPSRRRLLLQGNNLTGTIPEMGNCTFMGYFNVSHNRLTGALPASFRECAYLQEIDVSHNALVGSIPSGLGALTLLSAFDAASNDLSGSLPASFAKASRLVRLSLANNVRLGPLPAFLSSMPALEVLDLAGTDLRGTPPASIRQLQLLSLLSYLNLSSTRLPVASADFVGPLMRLTALGLAGLDSLRGPVPRLLGNFQSLRRLDLGGTSLAGAAPPELAELQDLGDLTLPATVQCPPLFSCSSPGVSKSGAFCRRCGAFCGTCPLLQDPSALRAVLDFQNATGAPGTWTPANLPGVRFEGDAVTGIFLPQSENAADWQDISALGLVASSLTGLGLAKQISLGAIPEAVSELTGLKFLDLSGNYLTGEVPESISRLSRLTHLDLSSRDPLLQSGHAFQNLLSASRLAPLQGLQFLSLASSSNGEPFPEALTNLTALTFLDLSGNGYVGSLPQGFSALSNLTYLDLRGNALSVGSPLGNALPASLASLPLASLFVDEGVLACPSARNTKCPTPPVDPRSSYCTQHCPAFCAACYSPPPPPSPPSPPSPPPVFVAAPGDGPPSGSATLPPGSVAAIAVGSAAVLLAALVVAFLVVKSRRDAADDDGVQRKRIRRFTLRELGHATGGFSESLGRGAYGEVFKGRLEGGEEVAVKRSTQGAPGAKGKGKGGDDKRGGGSTERGFRNEIKLLSSLHHKNLVTLLGYCLHDAHLLLVYEYVPLGSLEALLYRSRGTPGADQAGTTGDSKGTGLDCHPPLTWEQRLKIASGAAQGLHYLHSQVSPPVLHRDVKSGNILVTTDYDGKVGDFGLSVVKGDAMGLGPEGGPLVLGTRGYLDMDYYQTKVATPKSDVFSFGVVLLELATDRPPILKRQHILEAVVQRVQSTGWASLVPPSIAPQVLGPEADSLHLNESDASLGVQTNGHALGQAKGNGYAGDGRPVNGARGEAAACAEAWGKGGGSGERDETSRSNSTSTGTSTTTSSSSGGAMQAPGSSSSGSSKGFGDTSSEPKATSGSSETLGLIAPNQPCLEAKAVPLAYRGAAAPGAPGGQLAQYQRFVNLALRCCSSNSAARPSMYHVALELEELRGAPGVHQAQMPGWEEAVGRAGHGSLDGLSSEGPFDSGTRDVPHPDVSGSSTSS